MHSEVSISFNRSVPQSGCMTRKFQGHEYKVCPKPKYQFFFKSQCLHDQTGMVSANDHTHHRGVLTSQGDLPCALQILGTFRNSNTELAMDCVLKDTFTKKQC